jgi:hypothetical protein
METREYRTVDKSSWGPGPWQDEADKIQWQDEPTGLPCLVVRGPVGALCGYVGVSEGHPAFRKEYGSVDVECHGGLTFSDFCADAEDESSHICHVPAPGEPDHVWWFGFDCAHCWDLSPTMAKFASHDAQYRSMSYVRGQCRELARQLKALP